MIAKILAAPEAQRTAWSDSIVQCLKASDAWLPASGAVAMFGGGKSEPDLLPLIPWLRARGIDVAFFGMEEDSMHPYRIDKVEDLRVGKFGVLEPACHPGTRLAVSDLGVVLTPGLAFESVRGHRMGRGAGFYDSFFSDPECRAKRIGVGFFLQFCDTLAIEAHDIPMQAFVTEHGWVDVPAKP